MVDTVKTRAQLIERAGIALGLVQPGEALSSEDYDTLDDLVDAVLAQLAADEIIYVGNPEEILLEIFLPLSSLIANYAGPSFGSPINDDARRRDEGALRRINSSRPTYATFAGTYF